MFSIFKQFPNFLKERQFCSPRKIHGHSDKLMAQGADPQRSMKIQGGGVSSMSLYQCVSLYQLITTYTDIWTSHVYPTFVSFLILFLSTTCTVVSGLQPVGLPLNRFGRWSFQSRLVNIAPNGSFTVSHVFPSLWPLAARSHCFLVVLQARRYPPCKELSSMQLSLSPNVTNCDMDKTKVTQRVTKRATKCVTSHKGLISKTV